MADIARPADQAPALFYRWPEPEVAIGTCVVCARDEQVVLSANGRVLVVLAAGAHEVSPSAIPGLGAVGGDGPRLPVEVLFVNTGKAPMRFGGKLPAIRDPATSLTYEPRAFGTANLRVADAHLFASQLQAGSTSDDVVDFLKSKMGSAVADAIVASKASVTALSSPLGVGLISEVLLAANPFGSMGVAIASFEALSVNIDEETLRAAMQAKKAAAPHSPAPTPSPTHDSRAPAPLPTSVPISVREAAPEKVRCPVCGQQVRPGKFCMACGKLLSGKTFCACGAPLKPGANFCSNCGGKV